MWYLPQNNALVMAIQMWAAVHRSGHVTCLFCQISYQRRICSPRASVEVGIDLDVENAYFISVETRWSRSPLEEHKAKRQITSMIYAAGFPLMQIKTRKNSHFLKIRFDAGIMLKCP